MGAFFVKNDVVDCSISGKSAHPRDSKYKNNCIEQDHRPIKSRLRVMKGFKNIFFRINILHGF
jgi:transposase-like protein